MLGIYGFRWFSTGRTQGRAVKCGTLATLGEWLSRVIDSRGITQAEVADRAGIDRSNFSKVLSNKWVPRSATRAKIAMALGMRFSDFEEAWQTSESIESDAPRIKAGAMTGAGSQILSPPAAAEWTVEGDSLSPLLEDGDRIIFRHALYGEQPAPGEVVGVYLGPDSGHEGQALYQWAPLPNGSVRLMKANPKYPSIEVDPQYIERLLRVVRVVRRDA